MTLEEQLDHLPTTPGVYLFRDVVGDVLYVGKASSLRARVRSYFQPGADLHARVSSLVERVHDVDFVVADSEVEALVLEFNLIQRYRPRFNVRYRDDKSYQYIRIDVNEPFPALCIVRQRAIEPDGARYFGPYPSSRAMWETIRLVRRLFGICQRSVVAAKTPRPGKRGKVRRVAGCTWDPLGGKLRPRPCLDYYTKRCLGPCVGAVSAEEYQRAVRQVIGFLDGKQELVLGELRAEMEAAADELRFEQAARLRDQIQALERTLAEQHAVLPGREDVDVLGYALRADTGCITVLQVREGRMSGQEHHLLAGVSGVPAAEVLNEFAKQHYQKAASAPRRALLPLAIEDAAAIEELLTARRDRRVRLEVPRRGRGRKLVEMAMENAEYHLRSLLQQEGEERRRGQEAVADLQKLLALAVAPRRIEAFDISNLQGKTAVGSMIVFEDGLAKRGDYRRFRIQVEGEPNDYAMMHEVLSRRLKAAVSGNVKFAHLADLLLVDGGLGQLKAALAAMEALGLRLPVAGLAKEHEDIYLPGRSTPLQLPAHSRALHLLQRVRDEAHRFALAYHRTLRAREARESVLDQIPGVGEKRKQRLLSHFHSLSKLRQAAAEEIAEAAGCSTALARRIAAALAAASV